MNHVVALLIGPLAGPECRRALARGWVIFVRTLAGLATAGVVLAILWWWWLVGQSEPGYRPFYELRAGLSVVEAMLLTVAMIQGPAVLAGSLSGDRQRGVLSLLLSTRVSSREVVTGRLIGKLTQVGMILLAGVPPLILLASLAGIRPAAVLAMLAVPAAVGWGGGGMAALASTVSKRGRDALLAVYLFDVLLLIGPLASRSALPPDLANWLEMISPYNCLVPLVWGEEVSHALATIVVWLVLGCVGVAAASWRLRPSCLGTADTAKSLRRAVRRGWVPIVDEKRPMLWKELFIERVAGLGKAGRWASFLLTSLLVVGSVGLSSLVVFSAWTNPNSEWSNWAVIQLGIWVTPTAALLGFLIQWGVGLRASVSISSERERGTWDALLTSPLGANEIVVGKLWGSLYALRWLIGATFLAWGLAAAAGAWSTQEFVLRTVAVVFAGAFMAAVGVRTSLVCETATKAMAIVIGVWLGAYVGVTLLAAVTVASVVLVANTAMIALSLLGVTPPLAGMWLPRTDLFWPLTNDAVYLGLTLSIVTDTRLRFDRIAGRMTEGKLALAFEDALDGKQEIPVLIEDAERVQSPSSNGSGPVETPQPDEVAGPV